MAEGGLLLAVLAALGVLWPRLLAWPLAAFSLWLGLALLANKPFRVKWPVRLGLLLPWALPLVFAGLIFRWFFEYQTGVVNDLLMKFGFEPLQWLSSPTLATVAISIAATIFVVRFSRDAMEYDFRKLRDTSALAEGGPGWWNSPRSGSRSSASPAPRASC